MPQVIDRLLLRPYIFMGRIFMREKTNKEDVFDLIQNDVFADKFEQLFAEMLDDGFADFLGRVF